MEKIGIEAVWSNTDFNKGSADYIKQLDVAKTKTAQAQGATSGAGGLSLGLVGAFGLATAAVSDFVSVGLTALVSAGESVINIFGEMADAVLNFSKNAIAAASDVKELSYISQMLGFRAGYTAEATLEEVAAVRDVGISMEVANRFIAEANRYNINYASALKLASTAQDVATLRNEATSTALEAVINGITTLNVRLLRYHGILVNTDTAYADYVKQLDKTDPAIKHNIESLTEQQRVQAMVNAVIKSGTNLEGSYELAMETGGKQLKTLQSRLFPDLLATMGAPFQEAFYKVAEAVNYMVIAMTKMYSEGGGLYKTLVDLGAAASILADGISYAAKAFVDWDSQAIGPFMDRMSQAADDALTWGFDIATNLAIGLIEGANTAIQAAINYIGGMLSFNLASHSPPKVAPDIIKWGIDAVSQWLFGFTQGDYDILKDIESPLKEALGVIADLGFMAENQVGTTWANLSKQIISDMSTLGAISEDTYNKMREAGMMYGDELVALAKDEELLAAATKAETQAEKDLEAAKKAAEAAGLKSNNLLAEYNRMLRGGASRGALNDKLNELNVSKAAQANAEKEVDDAQLRLDIAKEQVKLMKEQSDLQKELLQQLLDLTKAQITAGQAAAKVPKTATGGGGGGGGGGANLDPGQSGLKNKNIIDEMKKAVDAAVDAIRAKWQNLVLQMQITLHGVWNQLPESTRNILDILLGPAPITQKLELLGVIIAGWLLDLDVKFGASIIETVNGAFDKADTAIYAKLGEWAKTFNEWVAGDPLKPVIDALLGKFVEWGGLVIIELGLMLGKFVYTAWTWASSDPLKATWDIIVANFATIGTAIYAKWSEFLAQLVTDATTWINSNPLKPLFDGIANGFSGMWSGLATAAGKAMDAMITELQRHIPAKLWNWLMGGGGTTGGGGGGSSNQNFSGGNTGFSNAANIGDYLKNGIAPAAHPMGSGNTYNTINLNFNNNLNNAIDVAMLRNLIIRTVKEAMVT